MPTMRATQIRNPTRSSLRRWVTRLPTLGTLATGSEAANVWSITLGDAHRAARVLMQAVDKDPTQETAAERLAQLYRDKGEHKALVALLERRAKALGPLAGQNPDLK